MSLKLGFFVFALVFIQACLASPLNPADETAANLESKTHVENEVSSDSDVRETVVPINPQIMNVDIKQALELLSKVEITDKQIEDLQKELPTDMNAKQVEDFGKILQKFKKGTSFDDKITGCMELAFFSLEHVAKDTLLKTIREFKATDVLDLAKKYGNTSE